MATDFSSFFAALASAEPRDFPICGLIVPFFSNDESDSEVEDVDVDADDPNTLSAFGTVPLSRAYITEQPGSGGLPFRKPRLKVSKPQPPCRRTYLGKEMLPHEEFLKSIRSVTSKPPTSPTSDFRGFFETLKSSRDLLMTTHPPVNLGKRTGISDG